jgi:hypothetical protein
MKLASGLLGGGFSQSLHTIYVSIYIPFLSVLRFGNRKGRETYRTNYAKLLTPRDSALNACNSLIHRIQLHCSILGAARRWVRRRF